NTSHETRSRGLYASAPQSGSLGQGSLKLFHKHVVLDHVFGIAVESDQVVIKREGGEREVYPGWNDSGVNPASNDHGRHREQHRPERGWKNSGFKNLGAADEFVTGRLVGDEIFDVLAGSDEIKHRHALRQRHQKSGKESPHDVLRYGRRAMHREAFENGNNETNNRKKRSRK